MSMWLTAREIAASHLPGLPASKRRINARAAAESWPSRPREGRGGGREYPLDALPAEARAELAARALPDLARTVIAPARQRPVLTLTALAAGPRARAEARTCAVKLADAYRAAAGLAETPADLRFADEWNAGRVAAEDWLGEELPTLSSNSLRRWRASIAAGDVEALAGRYKGDRATGLLEGNPVFRDFVVAQIAHAPHLKPGAVRDAMKARFRGLTIPSAKTLQRWMQRWRDENPRGTAMLENPDNAKNLYRVSFGSQSERVARINQVWEADATPADAMCLDGRFVVVGMIDVFTRRVRVLVTRTSKSQAVLALYRRCIIDWGFPELIKTDNGQEFKSRWVVSAMAAMGIEHRLCPPFTPEGKPHIERFFGSLNHSLFEMLPGYVGHSVADRQAIRARSAFAARQGEDDAKLFKVALTSEQLQAACDTWISGIYERKDHEGLDGAAPLDRARAFASAARRIDNERALDVLLAEPAGGRVRLVGKRGLAVEGGVYQHEALVAFMGRRVEVRLDAADLGRVIVHDEAGRFVCVAEDPERTGIDRAELAAKARATQSALDRNFRAAAKRAKRAHRPELSIAEILDDAAMRAAAEPPVLPGLAHASAALDQAADAARALDAPRAWTPRVIDSAPDAPEPPRAKSIDWDAANDLAGLPFEAVQHAPDAVFFQWVAQNRAAAEPHHLEEFERAMRDAAWRRIVASRLDAVVHSNAETKTAAG
ncbi:MAG: DDE-type integrase/transposase/recombinase [Tagaea sp.]|nr:DDE-type integrase/transposase/recombinase [Tagaea sp.]